ncbi:MAG: hypothetical protein QM703_01510 [Gemmatales bacterium]
MATFASRRYFLATTLSLVGSATAFASVHDQLQQAITKGRQFLVDLLDTTLDLLPEYRGSKVYWLFHDNYLASQVLRKSHPEIANKIDAALKREKVTSSGKIEVLFGEVKDHPACFHTELIELRRTGEKILKTERKTSRRFDNWFDYADLLFLHALCNHDCGQVARGCVQDGIKLWDGTGFLDPATKKLARYATYKLALARIASVREGPQEKVTATFLPKLLKLQDKSGGWITDYDATGKALGLANVETTCLVLMALETFAT